MTIKEASKRWGVTPSLIRRWCRAGRIPGARLKETERGQVWVIPANANKPVAIISSNLPK